MEWMLRLAIRFLDDLRWCSSKVRITEGTFCRGSFSPASMKKEFMRTVITWKKGGPTQLTSKFKGWSPYITNNSLVNGHCPVECESVSNFGCNYPKKVSNFNFMPRTNDYLLIYQGYQAYFPFCQTFLQQIRRQNTGQRASLAFIIVDSNPLQPMTKMLLAEI